MDVVPWEIRFLGLVVLLVVSEVGMRMGRAFAGDAGGLVVAAGGDPVVKVPLADVDWDPTILAVALGEDAVP